MLPFAEGRQGRSKEGKRQRDRGREGERGPRLFQLWTVLSTDGLKSSLKTKLSSRFMFRNLVGKEVLDTFYMLTLFT